MALSAQRGNSIPEVSQTKRSFDDEPLADVGERMAIFHVLDSFRQYRKQTHFTATHRRRQNFYALPQAHQKVLKEPPIAFLDTLNLIDDAIDENADIADDVLALAIETFGLSHESSYRSPQEDGRPEQSTSFRWQNTARALDLNKAHSTLRQLWRDWSREGFEAEVKPLLDIILHDLATYLPQKPDVTSSVLLPGAGLGRLLFELCMAGYHAEGNEISYHQLLTSNFILNSTSHADQYKLYPFITNFNNNISRENQMHMVTVPDIHPGSQTPASIAGSMNMTAGDFITSYASADVASTFNAVVTVYFIDTAPNFIRYMETIHNCLKDEGIWINIGPLLWHFEDRIVDKHGVDDEADHEEQVDRELTGIAEPGSFELTDEEVMVLAEKSGFELLCRSMLPASYGGYIQDPTSMLQSTYNCSHWVLRKRRQ